MFYCTVLQLAIKKGAKHLKHHTRGLESEAMACNFVVQVALAFSDSPLYILLLNSTLFQKSSHSQAWSNWALSSSRAPLSSQCGIFFRLSNAVPEGARLTIGKAKLTAVFLFLLSYIVHHIGVTALV